MVEGINNPLDEKKVGQSPVPAQMNQPAIPMPPHEDETAISIESLMNVTMNIVVEVGRAKRSMRNLLDMQNGTVIELDRNAGDVVDVLVNDHLIARGEVVVVDDKFGVRLTEVLSSKDALLRNDRK